MSQRQQVLGGGDPTGVVGGADAHAAGAAHPDRIDDHDREAGVGQGLDRRMGGVDGHEDRAHPPGPTQLVGVDVDPVAMGPWADHDLVARGLSRCGQSVEHGGLVRVLPLRKGHLDQPVRRLDGSTWRSSGRLVPGVAQQLLDPAPGRLGDIRAVVEHLRHGGDRDAGEVGDLRQGGAGLPQRYPPNVWTGARKFRDQPSRADAVSARELRDPHPNGTTMTVRVSTAAWRDPLAPSANGSRPCWPRSSADHHRPPGDGHPVASARPRSGRDRLFVRRIRRAGAADGAGDRQTTQISNESTATRAYSMAGMRTTSFSRPQPSPAYEATTTSDVDGPDQRAGTAARPEAVHLGDDEDGAEAEGEHRPQRRSRRRAATSAPWASDEPLERDRPPAVAGGRG